MPSGKSFHASASSADIVVSTSPKSLAVNIGGIANYTVATQNRLSGLQAGIALRVLDGADLSPAIAGLYGDVTGRIGRYDNADTLTTTSTGVAGAVPFIAASDSAHTTAIELDATIGYRFHRTPVSMWATAT